MNRLTQKLAAFPNSMLLAWGWQRRVFCLLSGALSALALPPYGWFPVLFLTIPALVWILDGAIELDNASRLQKAKTGFSLGWLFGFGFFLAGLWWVGAAFLVEADRYAWLMPFALVAMPAGLALFTALGMALAGGLWTDGSRRILVFAASLTLAEWMRGHLLTGFPWNTFGYAFSENLVLSQAASVVGIYGLGFAVLAISAAPAVLADAGPLSRRLVTPLLGALGLVLLAVYGTVRLWSAETVVTDLDIRIVQPAIDQRDKWRPELRDEIFQTYLDMTEQPLTGSARLDVPRLVVWPESAVPFLLTQEPGALSRIAGALGPDSELAIGAVRAEGGPAGADYFNSVYLIDHNGAVTGLYDKVRLVPFGEYVPLKGLLTKLGIYNLAGPPSGFKPGFSRKTISTASGFSFLPLICYEVIFPGAISRLENSTGFLLNLTNDAWFGRTPGPYQHFAQARMRAIETGVPLVRAANTGISAIVDGYGRVTQELPIFRKGILDGSLPKKLETTIYGVIGDHFALIISTFIVVFASISRRNRISRLN